MQLLAIFLSKNGTNNKKSSNNEIENDEDIDSSQEYLERVGKIIDDEDKQEEVIKLTTIALKFKESSEAYSFRSVAKINLEDYEGASSSFNRVSKSEQREDLGYFQVEMNFKLGRFKTAIQLGEEELKKTISDNDISNLSKIPFGFCWQHTSENYGFGARCKAALVFLETQI